MEAIKEWINQNEKPCIFCESKLNINDLYCLNCNLSQEKRILTDWEIKELLKNNIIIVEPILNLKKQLEPIGLELRLDTKIRRFRSLAKEVIDPSEEIIEHEFYEFTELEYGKEKHFVLHPGEFVLTQSFEYVRFPPFIGGVLDGKSSLGRLGIIIHATAPRIDPGFQGHLVYELSNVGKMPVRLKPLMRVARLVFYVTEHVETPYMGKYQYQSNIKPSQIFKEQD